MSADRGTWKLVARRDFWVRLRDRGFLISTAITLVILTALILIRADTAVGSPSYAVGLVGSSVPVSSLDALGLKQGVTIHARAFPDLATGEAALRRGAIDALLENDRTIVGLHGAPSQPLQQLIGGAVVETRIADALSRAGLSEGQRRELLRAVAPAALDPGDPNAGSNARVAIVMVLLLYGQLFGYGVWVATGVIEEKSSRVVEILLSSIRARQLLAGKILGIGLLGLMQLAVIATVAATLAAVTGVVDIPAHAFLTIGVALLWFLFGFGFYSSIFAVAASLVSRMEELQNAIVPINLTILGSLFVSIGSVDHPDTVLARVASLLPFSSALAMPVRIAVGSATLPQAVLSLAILVGSIAALVPLAGRFYSGAVLRIGARVKLRDAWRAAA